MAKSELMEQAMKEGITVDDQDTNQELPGSADSQEPGAKETASPASTQTETEQTSQGDGAKVASEQTENEPWHKSERFRKLTERNKQLEERLSQVEKQYTVQLEQALKNINKTPQQQANLPPEQKQALLDLVKLIKSDPEASKELGLGSNESLQSEIQRMQSERAEESFNTEFDRVIDSAASKYGIDKEELKEEVVEFLQTDNTFSSRQYQPGMVDKAIKVMLFDRLDELKTRATNLKLIQEQKLKKSQNTEAPSKSQGSKGVGLPHNMRDFLKDQISKGGGISV